MKANTKAHKKTELTDDTRSQRVLGLFPQTWITSLLAGLLLLLLAVQCLLFIQANSQTNDEIAHIAAGYSYLVVRDFRLNPEHPPLVKELCALPLLFLRLRFPCGPLWDNVEQWHVGRRFVHEQKELLREQTGKEGPSVSNDTILFWGRVPVLVLSLVLGGFLFSLGRDMYGVRAGLLALALYVLDPNVVTHSSLITTDMGVTVFIFLAVYMFWQYVKHPGPRRIVWLGVMIGGAAAAKFTAIWLVPIFVCLSLPLILGRTPLPERPWRFDSNLAASRSKRLRAIASVFGLALAAGLVILLAAYFLRGIPAIVQGLRKAVGHTGSGHETFLFGEYAQKGWWYYFIAAFSIKTPIGTLALLGLSLYMTFVRPREDRPEGALSRGIFLAIPILVILVLTAGWTINIGLRHLLPLYPFLFLFIGKIAVWQPQAKAYRLFLPLAVVSSLLWNAREAVAISPYHLTYFNQFAGGPDNGVRCLSDSNIDWGQCAKALKTYVERQQLPGIYCAIAGNSDPWYYGVRYQYVPGTKNLDTQKRRGFKLPSGIPRELLAVSVMVLQGLHLSDHDAYAWLRSRTPIDIVGHSIFVYDITGDEIAHLQIAIACAGFKLHELAAHEARRVLEINPQNAVARSLLEKIANLPDAPSPF